MPSGPTRRSRAGSRVELGSAASAPRGRRARLRGGMRECTPLGHCEWEGEARHGQHPARSSPRSSGCARSPVPRGWWAHIALPDGHCRQEQHQLMGPALVYTASLTRAAPAFWKPRCSSQMGHETRASLIPHHGGLLEGPTAVRAGARKGSSQLTFPGCAAASPEFSSSPRRAAGRGREGHQWRI